MRLSYSGKFILGGLVIFIVSALFLILFYRGFLRSDLLQKERDTLMHEARLAAQALSYAEQDLIAAEGDRLARELSERIQARATIIQFDGKVLGDSSQPASQMANHSDRPEFQQALEGQVGIIERYSLTEGESYLYVAVPVGNQPPVRTVFRLSLPETALLSTLSRMEKWMWVSLGAGSALFFLLTFLLFRYLNSPLRKMAMTFQTAERGEPAAFRVRGKDEVGELARFYNAFVEREADLTRRLRTLELKCKFAEHGGSGFLTLNESFQILSATTEALEMLEIPERRLLGHTILESTLNHALDEGVRRAIREDKKQLVQHSARTLSLRGILLDLSQEEWALISLEDITELEVLRKVRRDFIANLSHELRTPISSISAILETISRDPAPPEEVRAEFLKKALREIDYLSSLLESLSRLYLIESGRMEFHPEDLDIGEFLMEIKSSLDGRAAQLGLLFDLEIPREQIIIQADRLHLREAFLAILDNSFKFTPRGRQVSIQASSRAGWVTVDFRDQGKGISREDLPRIFERFYKTDKGRSTEGFGIGLSLAKHIIESFSGTLTAISDEGKGALFIVRLPVLKSGGESDRGKLK